LWLLPQKYKNGRLWKFKPQQVVYLMWFEQFELCNKYTLVYTKLI